MSLIMGLARCMCIYIYMYIFLYIINRSVRETTLLNPTSGSVNRICGRGFRAWSFGFRV